VYCATALSVFGFVGLWYLWRDYCTNGTAPMHLAELKKLTCYSRIQFFLLVPFFLVLYVPFLVLCGEAWRRA